MKLHAANYETYLAQAEKYTKEIEKINSDLANTPANDTLLDKKEEYIKAQRESVKAAQDEKYAMIDLAKQGYEAQKNYLQKVIDKYKKLLSIQKDAYEYQKTLSDAMDEINAVQKQLSAISGDNSEETRAKRQELTANLKEKQDALKEKQLDKLTSDINDMFDALMDDYSDYMDDIINNLPENFEQLINAVNENSASANKTVMDMASGLNLELQGLKDIFSGGESGNVLVATQNSVKNIEAKQTELVNKANQIASSVLGNGGQSSSGGTKDVDLSNVLKERNLKPLEPVKPVAEQNKSQKLDPLESVITGNTIVNMTDVKSYIKKHASKASKKKSEYSDFNKVIFDNKAKLYDGSGKVLSSDELKALAKKVGVKYDNATKKGALYKKFKDIGIKGFASGSRRIPHDQLALTQEKGPEMITLPDGTMLTPLKEGSKVFNDKMTENLWRLSQDENVIKMFKDTAMPRRDDGIEKLADILGKTLQYENVVNQNVAAPVNIGNVEIVLPNVHNRKEFAAEMKDVIKHELSVQKLLKGVTIDTLGRNYNSLSIRKY